jgi:hypothetical protein
MTAPLIWMDALQCAPSLYLLLFFWQSSIFEGGAVKPKPGSYEVHEPITAVVLAAGVPHPVQSMLGK